MSSRNNNPKGILFILTGMALFSVQDSLIKYIFEDTALYELYFGRTLTALILLALYLKITSQKLVMKTYYPLLTTVRVICFFLDLVFLYFFNIYVSSNGKCSIFFKPFLYFYIGYIFLGEKVGIRRWLAIIVGFLGVYIVLNPNFENFNYTKLAPVACALFYAISMTITKITSDKDSVYSQMFHLYIGAIGISIIFFIFTGKGQFNTFSDPTLQFILREWFTNPTYSWPFILIMGLVASLSFYFVFSAYSIASPSVVSLFEYSLIIWAIIIGYLLFNDIPTVRTFIGVALIIGAGVYIYIREKARDQMIASDTPNR